MPPKRKKPAKDSPMGKFLNNLEERRARGIGEVVNLMLEMQAFCLDFVTKVAAKLKISKQLEAKFALIMNAKTSPAPAGKKRNSSRSSSSTAQLDRPTLDTLRKCVKAELNTLHQLKEWVFDKAKENQSSLSELSAAADKMMAAFNSKVPHFRVHGVFEKWTDRKSTL